MIQVIMLFWPQHSCNNNNNFPTSSRSLEAVEQVDPLNVVGESGVGHQGLVAVYVIDSELERQLIHAHQLALPGLENTTWMEQ